MKKPSFLRKAVWTAMILSVTAILICSCSPNKQNGDGTGNNTAKAGQQAEQVTNNKTVNNFSFYVPENWTESHQSGNNQYYYYADTTNFIMASSSDYAESFVAPVSATVFDSLIQGMTESMQIAGEVQKSEFSNPNGVSGYSATMVSIINGSQYSINLFAFTHNGHLNYISFLGELTKLEQYLPVYKESLDSIKLLNTNSSETTPAPSASATPEPTQTPAYTTYQSGQYKVGVDLPAGEYLVVAQGTGYFCVSSDANADDILFNDNFNNNSIITVANGQYVELTRCYAIPFAEAPNFCEGKTVLDEGMYKVGYHLPAGEYKITASGTSMGYYCIYPDSTHNDILSNDNFNGSRYISVSDGQYLVLTRCSLTLQ